MSQDSSFKICIIFYRITFSLPWDGVKIMSTRIVNVAELCLFDVTHENYIVIELRKWAIRSNVLSFSNILCQLASWICIC